MASENPTDAVEADMPATSTDNATESAPAEPSASPAASATQSTQSTTQSSQSTQSTSEDTQGDNPRADAKDSGRRHRFENMLPNLIRRGIEKSIEAGLNTFEKSVETGRETSGAVREALHEVRPREMASAVGKALSEAKLPREIASAVFGQLDETKNDVVRIVAREVRDFLEATDIATEIKKALTSLSFEVRTEVRFIPNEAGDGVKPSVRSRGALKRSRTSGPRDRVHRRGKVRAKPAAEVDDEDEE